jgi:predicted permease
VQLVLPADWRVLGFASALAVAVTVLFGLVPALRASTVQPVSSLKGGEDVHSRHRLMNALIAAQVAFCFLVHFVAGLFVATFDRLSSQPTGFSSERVLALDTTSPTSQPSDYWHQVVNHLRSVAGVESAAVCGWPLMSGNAWTSDIWLNGRVSQGQNPYFLSVSDGWMTTMRVPVLNGRDFRSDDQYPDVAIVNEAFAHRYFDGQNPVGRTFETKDHKKSIRTRIVGQVRDVRYASMREPMKPVVFVPFNSKDDKGGLRAKDWGTLLVRYSAANPAALTPILRREIPRIRPEFRVSNIHTQAELVLRHTVRERLLATLSLFFAAVALLLAGVGLYGVLNYSVVQRRREIGIRMALGARPANVARRVTAQIFGMLFVGAAVGLAAGMACERYVQTLLYQVTARDLGMVSVPAVTLFTVAVIAAVPPVIRAIRIDPAVALRTE